MPTDRKEVFSFHHAQRRSMSNAPFKIAFWVMSLAFGLTVLLTGLKPEEIRSALNSDRRLTDQEEELGTEQAYWDSEQVVSAVHRVDTDEPLPEQPASNAPFVHPQPFPESGVQPAATSKLKTAAVDLNQQREFPVAKPIQVASSDPDLALGLEPVVSSEEGPIVPIPDKQFAERSQAGGEAFNPMMVQRPVPPPVDVAASPRRMSLTDEVTLLKEEILRLRLLETRRELDVVRRDKVEREIELVEFELTQLNEQISTLKNRTDQVAASSESIAVAEEPTSIAAEAPVQEESAESKLPIEAVDAPAPPSQLTETNNEQADEPESDETLRESVINVVEAEDGETYSFEFQDASIIEVLQLLASRSGRKIVLEKEIDGTYSGSFPETTAEQAFASVIKANHFGLSYRGSYTLVRAHRDPKIR